MKGGGFVRGVYRREPTFDCCVGSSAKGHQLGLVGLQRIFRSNFVLGKLVYIAVDRLCHIGSGQGMGVYHSQGSLRFEVFFRSLS